MMRKKFIALLTSSLAIVLILQNLLSPPLLAAETAPTVNISTALTNLDRESFRPEDIEQSDKPSGGTRAIIGTDEREPMLTRAYPWSTVGRLEWQLASDPISSCTATLVQSDIILTNSHCLLLPVSRENSEEPDGVFINANQYSQLLQAETTVPKLIFKPSMINGVALDEAAVIALETGWTIDDYDPAKDWALMKLDAPLGNIYGYLGWRDLDFSNNDVIEALFESTNLVGYSGDFPTESLREFGQSATTAGVDRACSILGLWSEGPFVGTIAHDCDTNPRSLGRAYISEVRKRPLLPCRTPR